MATGNLDYPPAKGKSLPPRVRATIASVAEYHGMTVEDLLGPERSARLNHYRRLAMLAVRANLQIDGQPPTLVALGQWFRRCEATVTKIMAAPPPSRRRPDGSPVEWRWS